MAEGESAFSGYQLLLEYFTFREKFMFVQLNGTENITLPAGISHFTLEVVFCEVWQSDLPVSASSLRLHCVPVINLFTLEADPLTISGPRANTSCVRSACRTGIPKSILLTA